MDFSNRLIRDTLKYIPGIFLFLQAEFAIAEEFSIVVLPDTQFYSQNNPAIFNAQTQWIRTNLATENIIYVAHLGDIVDSFGCNGGPTEWGNADTAMDELDGAPTTADDIAYGVLPGNHDWDPTTPGGSTCDTTRNQYNANFGPGRYGSYYGGNQFSSATNNDNNYRASLKIAHLI